jgi:succinoglycan biosynthesis transport protein ExoP
MEIFTPSPSDPVHRASLGDTVDLREVLAKFWARKRLILACIIVCGGLAFGLVKLITPVYSSSALVMIKTQSTADPNAQAMVAAGQAFVLQSRGLASETIERLHLDRDPEFNPLLRNPNFLLALYDEIHDGLNSVLGTSPGAPTDRNADAKSIAAGGPSPIVVDKFMKWLSVAVQPGSNVIRVSFSAARPTTAAMVPNTLIALYLEHRIRERQQELAEEIAWLDQTLPKLRRKMQQSQLALAGYRRKAGLVNEENPAILGQELANIKAQLDAAQARKAEAAARLAQFQAFLSRGQSASPPGSLTAETESPVLRLQEQAVDLQAQLAALRGSLGADNPKTLQLAARLREVREGVRRASVGVISRLRLELVAAEASVMALKERAAEYTREFSQANGGDTRLASLISQADVDRQIYNQYLKRANETQSDIGHVQADASLVSGAAIPLKPYFPNIKILLLVGLTIGAGVGIVLAAMSDALLGGLRSKQQVEEALGIKCLGLIPRLKRPRRSRLPIAKLRNAVGTPTLLQPQNEGFGQTIRSVQLKLRGFDPQPPCRTMLVTAALPREGKTWVAVSLAASLAAEGFSVALIDCDLRRPAVHRMLGGAREPGLTDFFSGGVAVDAIIHNDPRSGVDYIPVGAAPAKSAWRITFDRLSPLVDQLRGRYAFVILDSAPVLAIAETAILAQIAQKTIFVIRWGSTPPAIVHHALVQLSESGGSEPAALLSMVDLKRAARRGDVVAGVYQRLQGYYGH